MIAAAQARAARHHRIQRFKRCVWRRHGRSESKRAADPGLSILLLTGSRERHIKAMTTQGEINVAQGADLTAALDAAGQEEWAGCMPARMKAALGALRDDVLPVLAPGVPSQISVLLHHGARTGQCQPS